MHSFAVISYVHYVKIEKHNTLGKFHEGGKRARYDFSFVK